MAALAAGLLQTNSAARAGDAPLDLSCSGAFARDASRDSLIRAFGKANVKEESVDGAEGETLSATVIFPADPARRVEVFWFDEQKRRKPSTFRVREGFAGKVLGLGLGATLHDVETANGGKLSLNGFEWDMGGWVTSFEGGKLAKPAGGCAVSLRFEPGPSASEAARTKVAGDRMFSSANPAMKAAKPVISEMGIGWAE
jgi:hypothetical protein